jgi:hypothetical protein
VCCELARTDAHRFRVLEPDNDETKAIRALTRAREDLVMARAALTNQLRLGKEEKSDRRLGRPRTRPVFRPLHHDEAA